MRHVSLVFGLFAFLCSAAPATAQWMEGTYVSTNLHGGKITPGHTYYIDVWHIGTDENGIEEYITQSSVIHDATGITVATFPPGTLEWDPMFGVGMLTGSNGNQGWLFDPAPGSGTFVADYSGAGGNIRAWTRQ